MDPGGRPDARHATGSTQSAVFCCPVMMVTKILGELWQNSGLLARKSVFGTALMGMISFHLTLLWYQNIKTSLCTLFKNVWVMPFFITFRSARKKLHVTVFFDHPVVLSDTEVAILSDHFDTAVCQRLRGTWCKQWKSLGPTGFPWLLRGSFVCQRVHEKAPLAPKDIPWTF